MLESLQNAVVAGLLRVPSPVLSIATWPDVVVDGGTLDAQTRLLLRMMGLARIPLMHELDPSEARKLFSTTAPSLGPAPRLTRVENRRIPGPSNEIPVRIYAPHGARGQLPVTVYYHGGGWVVGDLDTHDLPLRKLAHDAETLVVSVDYRRAPEHKFPAAVLDATAAYRWVRAHASTIGGDPARVAVAGDSAGGNLAAVVSQITHKADEPAPDFQLLIYPVTDLSAESRSYELFAEGYFLERATMRWFANLYLEDEQAARDPRASPLLANDVSGLPPAYIATAGFDPLRDEGEAYAARLQRAKVPVELRRYPSLIHGFVAMAGAIDEAGVAFDDLATALRAGLTR